jgi:hypothetical protein
MTKMGLATFWAIFSTNVSGHPVGLHPAVIISCGSLPQDKIFNAFLAPYGTEQGG